MALAATLAGIFLMVPMHDKPAMEGWVQTLSPASVPPTTGYVDTPKATPTPYPRGGNYGVASDVTFREASLISTAEQLRRRELEGKEFNAADVPPGPDESPFVSVDEAPLSTFAVDVDTTSYSGIRSMILSGVRPPRAMVRIEEMINYFQYSLPPPTDGKPFALHVDVTDAPWKTDHLLARVALKAREIPRSERLPANLVFLIDVSCSMDAPERLPLLKDSLSMLVEQLGPEDRVSIVTYAGTSGVLLQPTLISERRRIFAAISSLVPGGSPNAESGIQLAYATAQSAFRKGGTNRVILATDGDFNVGAVANGDLTALITERAKHGVFLSVLGFGMSYRGDSRMETLADKGNGNYAFIDSVQEAKKVLMDALDGTLHTVAKDVKIQLEINPAKIESYRLIGYENRRLAARDFHDDTKDAGEIGAGHAVTALYELVPRRTEKAGAEPLRYRQDLSAAAHSGELFTAKLRYKLPDGDRSELIERPVHESQGHFAGGSQDLKLAAAVAAFGMLLRDSPHKGDATYERAAEWARAAVGADPGVYRAELVRLIETAAQNR